MVEGRHTQSYTEAGQTLVKPDVCQLHVMDELEGTSGGFLSTDGIRSSFNDPFPCPIPEFGPCLKLMLGTYSGRLLALAPWNARRRRAQAYLGRL